MEMFTTYTYTFCDNESCSNLFKFSFRNSTLLSLVTKLLPSRPPLEREMPIIEDLASSMNNYTIDRVAVNYVLYLVYNETLTKLTLIRREPQKNNFIMKSKQQR